MSGNVCRQSGDPLVHVVEGLQVGKLHEREQRLFERIPDQRGPGQYPVEALFDEVRHLQRVEDRARDCHSHAPESSRSTGIGKQIVRKRRVQIENGMPAEADVRGRILDQDLDGVLVVEDHLRFTPILALRLFAELDEARRIEQGIGVALQTTGVPGQVDQKPVQDPASRRCPQAVRPSRVCRPRSAPPSPPW